MQHEIQIRPGEVPVKRGHYDDSAEMAGLMIVVVIVGNVFVWVTGSIWLNGDEHGSEEGALLP